MNKRRNRGWANGRIRRRVKRWARRQYREWKKEVGSSAKNGAKNGKAKTDRVVGSVDNWWDRRHHSKQSHIADRAGNDKPSFLARHMWLADVRDWFSMKGHAWMDGRELRGGVITQAEFDELDNYDGPEEWRKAMRKRRAEDRETQRSRQRDFDYGPLMMVYGGGQKAGLPQVQHTGFRQPAVRPSRVLQPVKAGTQPWAPPGTRPARRRRKGHVQRTAASWKPQLVANGKAAMASSELSSAVSTMMEFADTFPETRTQVHEKMGVLGEFGKSNGEFYEHLIATLRNGVNASNPGLPSEVLQHIEKLSEIGAQIEQAAHETLAAWEDYFANAIQAAQDEHTPSKEALTS